MKKEELKKLIDTAAGRIPADVVIRNCKIVNVFFRRDHRGRHRSVRQPDRGHRGLRGEGSGWMPRAATRAPGFIDSHIHIESAYVSPEEIGRLLVPHGGTTIIADPHEIVNVVRDPRPGLYDGGGGGGRSWISGMSSRPACLPLPLSMREPRSTRPRWRSRSPARGSWAWANS